MDSEQHLLLSPTGQGQLLLEGRRPPVAFAESDLPRPPRGGSASTVGTDPSGWLLASLAVVALLTLAPVGRGWAWGSPAVELRWYLTGLDSSATVLQLAGNVALLAVPAVLAVLTWPALGRLPRLTAVSLAVGTGIELLQWALPLGRVVSPLDTLLNATGAVVVGLVAAHLRRTGAGAAGADRTCTGAVGGVGEAAAEHAGRADSR